MQNRPKIRPAASTCLQTQSMRMQTFPKPTLINVLLSCFSRHRLVSTRCSATCFLGVKCYPEFVVWNSLKETPSVMERLKLQPPEYMNKKEESKVIHEFSRVLVFFLILFFPFLCFRSGSRGSRAYRSANYLGCAGNNVQPVQLTHHLSLPTQIKRKSPPTHPCQLPLVRVLHQTKSTSPAFPSVSV